MLSVALDVVLHQLGLIDYAPWGPARFLTAAIWFYLAAAWRGSRA